MEKVKKVLILGSGGLIGHKIFLNLKKNSNFRLFSLSKTIKIDNGTTILDINNFRKFEKYLKKIKPDFIINCVGLLIEDSEKFKLESIFLNAFLPNYLYFFSKKNKCKLIQISTDCVFSGNDRKPYKELDLPDGLSNYAKTKSLGEINEIDALTIRTSVVGPQLKEGGELFHWFMNQSGKINGYKKAFWSGVTTLELSKFVHWAILNKINGIYNLTNNKKISKYELLLLFKKFTKKSILIDSSSDVKTDKSFVDTRKEIDYQIPTYRTMIKNMINDIKSNKSLYSHYDF